MLNVWPGNRSAISYCSATHSSCVQVQNHTSTHSCGIHSCICQNESKHLPVLPTTWQTHVCTKTHFNTRLQLLRMKMMTKISLCVCVCMVEVCKCMPSYSMWWPEGSWQRGLSLHCAPYNYRSQTGFTTAKPKLQGSTTWQDLQHENSSTLASSHSMPGEMWHTGCKYLT